MVKTQPRKRLLNHLHLPDVEKARLNQPQAPAAAFEPFTIYYLPFTGFQGAQRAALGL
jgi:hypothetical protein